MIPTIRFEESVLSAKLENLSKTYRVAFAAACAQRLQEAYVKFSDRTGKGDSAAFVRIVDRLWDDLAGQQKMSAPEVDTFVEACMRLIPQGDRDGWLKGEATAEDAGAALAYTMRCRKNGSAMEAVWAARRVYEAVDRYVIRHEKIDTNAAGSEAYVLAHRLVQAELMRQQRDVDDLLRGIVDVRRLQKRSKVGAKTLLV